jgi:hypothetical protein
VNGKVPGIAGIGQAGNGTLAPDTTSPEIRVKRRLAHIIGKVELELRGAEIRAKCVAGPNMTLAERYK